ncbi:MAG: hypothetical protein M1834_002435 [Cirrosporium novae-zelandiae]|nr:MAG: hypothetical protein M1834_002435 [Cirrosporium novae-zelandiae]
MSSGISSSNSRPPMAPPESNQKPSTSPRRTAFRFKSKTKSSKSSREESSPYHRPSRHHHHRHHRHSSRHESSTHQERSISPDTAFRESLFDALADDEGAAFWEGIYGQPVHTYPRPEDPKGELEKMTDEEYATYVRAKMWEKSVEYIEEERQRRKEQKRKEKEDESKKQYEKSQFCNMVEERLQAGSARKMERESRKKWTQRWEQYEAKWGKLTSGSSMTKNTKEEPTHKARIPWPVESGSHKDISRSMISTFMKNAPATSLLALLKTERIRWHPDKMQQRSGGSMDEETMKNVTAVFQIIDTLLSEEKERQKGS